MRGCITRRGKHSWQLKFDIARDETGKRQFRYETIKGTRKDAERALARMLNELHEGTLAPKSVDTVATCLCSWLDGPHGLAAKTAERYRQLAERQITPHLGDVEVQTLKPVDIQRWHAILIERGGSTGKPLSRQTVVNAHAVLRAGLERAVKAETLSRNPAKQVSPPSVQGREVAALSAGEMAIVLAKLEGDWLHPIAALALASGCRRGEIMALRWSDVDLDAPTIRIDRSLEETAKGLAFKPPKTRYSRRTISLPATVVATLEAHRARQSEMRLALGLGGKPELVFCQPDGSPMSPDGVSRAWARAVKRLKLPSISFHGLRHSHASALIADGLDVLTVSRRLGHGNPNVTLGRYAHLFHRSDESAAKIIDNALKARPKK